MSSSATNLPMSGGSVPSSRGKKRVSESRRKLCHTLTNQRTAIVDQAAGTGMMNHMILKNQSQLRRLTRYFCAAEVEVLERDQFAYVWRQRAFIAWKKESVRKSKKLLSYCPIDCRSVGWGGNDLPITKQRTYQPLLFGRG